MFLNTNLLVYLLKTFFLPVHREREIESNLERKVTYIIYISFFTFSYIFRIATCYLLFQYFFVLWLHCFSDLILSNISLTNFLHFLIVTSVLALLFVVTIETLTLIMLLSNVNISEVKNTGCFLIFHYFITNVSSLIHSFVFVLRHIH